MASCEERKVDVPKTLAMNRDAAYVKELHDMQRKHKDDEYAEEASKTNPPSRQKNRRPLSRSGPLQGRE
jgi:hypothetical protein